MVKTEISEDYKRAADVIRKGGIVIFPTETVYGIGASSYNEEACKKIYKIKSRPQDNPFIIHVHSISEFEDLAFLELEYKNQIQSLIPGPISFILKKKKEVFSTGLPTIGLRVPSGNIISDFLKFAGPVSAPSANLSGKPSITRFNDIIEEFSGKVDFILKFKEPEIGIESTVIDLSVNPPILLRPGKISFSFLKIKFPNLILPSKEINEIKSPRVKYKHYSPDCKLQLIKSIKEISTIKKYGYIGFDSSIKTFHSVIVKTNEDYMKNLYSFFIDCDKKGIKEAYCDYPKDDDSKMALLNRLEKAVSGK
ncbi:MAG: threonylcarbamoyl-AMP synthase [Leptospiraceae bacterium]|nr:threonylcarbamoyl-AMP synthase [Leptospiraceae bacterium]